MGGTTDAMCRLRRYFAVAVLLLSCSGGVAAQRGLLQETECRVGRSVDCPGAAFCVAEETCVEVPIGGVIVTTNLRQLPTPLAYFPLSSTAQRTLYGRRGQVVGSEVVSWPLGELEGTVEGATLVEDADFGAVHHCNAETDDGITLDGVRFGRDGFTVNLWIKRSRACERTRDATEVIFSTVGRFGREEAQLELQLGSDGGAVSGSLSTHADAPPRQTETDVCDGHWHMVTMTLIPRGGDLLVYLDGEVVMEAERSRFGRIGPSLGEGIQLCAALSDTRSSPFDGSIAQLSIFDEDLSPEQIQQIYQATSTSVLTELTEPEDRSEPMIRYEDGGILYVRAAEFDSGIDGRAQADEHTTHDMLNGFDYNSLRESSQFCSSSSSECPRRDVCALLPVGTLDFLIGPAEEADGICARPMNSGTVWDGTSEPVPLAYFPLRQRNIRSWPIENKRGYRVETRVVRDDIFGRVLSCSKTDRSVVVLENVPYGLDGTFGLNLWFKAENVSGRFLQYLFSHSEFDPTSNPWAQNQVQIFLPEADHVGAGVLRALVKDSDDTEDAQSGAIFLDSDGEVAKTFTKDASSVEDQPIAPSDGDWHMVTLTSHGAGFAGYSMFLDGELVGDIEPEETYRGDSDVVKDIPGSEPLRMGGKIYLCGRSDGSSVRHFDGRIAELSLFSQSLSQRDVSALYEAALDRHPDLRS